MALKVGELYATMRLDSGQFDRGLDQSGQKFAGLQKVIAAGAKTAATMFAGAVTGVAALGVSALKVGLSYNRMQQSSRAALSTLLGGAEAANAQMDKLDEFATTSPFAKDVFIRAQQQMIGFGIETEKVIPYLDSIQNAVAAVGGSNDDISELTRIFSQIQSSAKITAEDLNQFGERGVNAAGLIGQEMGKTGAEIREAISNGSIDAEEALDALAAAMQDRFGGATALIKQQFDGAADRVKAAFRDIGGVLAAPFIDPNGGGRAVEWTNKVADAMRALQEKVGPTVDILMQRFAPAIDSITPMLDSARGAINAIDLSKLNGQLDELGKYAPLIAGTGAALFAFGASNLPILSALGISGINPVVAGLAALAATSSDVRAAGGDVLRSLEPLVPIISSLGVDLADLGVQILQEIVPALGELLSAGGETAVALAGALSPAVLDLVSAASPLVSLLADVVGWISDLPTPVLAAGLAFAALNGPLQSLGPLASGLGDALRQFRDMSRVQSALGGVGEAGGALGAAMVGAQSGIKGVGLALKTAFMTNPIGLAIAGITTAISLFASAQADAKADVQEFAQTMDESTGAITENTRALIANKLEAEGILEKYRDLGGNTQDLVSAVAGDPAAWDRVNAKLQEFRGTIGGNGGIVPEMEILKGSAGEVDRAIRGMRGQVEDASDSSWRQAEALGAASDATATAEGASSDYADQLAEQKRAQEDAADAALSLAEATQSEEDAQRNASDAIDKYNELAADSETSERDLERARADMERQLLNLARANGRTTDAMKRNNESGMALRQTVQEQRAEFIKTAREMGYTADEARALADEYGLIPDSVETIIRAETASAQRAVNSFIETNNGRTIYVRVEGRQISYGTSAAAGRVGGPQRYEATGDVLEFFSRGGIKGASPMSAAVPAIVPANTLRVIGDRPHGDEAFIPLLPGSQRSVALWEEAGRRLGTLAVGMAGGGILGQPAVSRTIYGPQFTSHITVEDRGARRVAEELVNRQKDAMATYAPALGGAR